MAFRHRHEAVIAQTILRAAVVSKTVSRWKVKRQGFDDKTKIRGPIDRLFMRRLGLLPSLKIA